MSYCAFILYAASLLHHGTVYDCIQYLKRQWHIIIQTVLLRLLFCIVSEVGKISVGVMKLFIPDLIANTN